MSIDSKELPVFPTAAPAVLSDRQATQALFAEVLGRLAAVVDVGPEQLDRSTPCADFTVAELRDHVLGWLQFFAAALSDPAASSPRPDPEGFALGDGPPAGEVVARALGDIQRAIAGGAASELVTMSSARMAGDGVLGMALGEYIVHAWDLATATGQPYAAPEAAIGPAHELLLGMVAPEYRGPGTGFFDVEVPVPDDASPLDKLLGFAGRDPRWSPGS
jgi:uncharacterized protein (TIGR03086 family)